MARPRQFDNKTVLKMRERFAKGNITVSALATEFGVAPGTIKAILTGKTYSDVGGPTI